MTTVGMACLAILVLFMLAGVIPAAGGGQEAIFRSPMFLVFLSVLAVLLIARSWRRGFGLSQLGFYAAHLGVVILLLGALVAFLRGQRADFSLPVDPGADIRELPAQDGKGQDLGFNMSAARFSVEYYEPSYHLYALADRSTEDYRFVRTVNPAGNDVLDLKDHGTVPVRTLREADGEGWKPKVVLGDGSVLQRATPVARHFETALQFRSPGEAPVERVLTVNHPVSYGGWRFYLMSYDKDTRGSVVLHARRDPGRPLVVTGIWMIIVGVTALCWRRQTPASAAGEGNCAARS